MSYDTRRGYTRPVSRWGDRIKELRDRFDITQEELAARITKKGEKMDRARLSTIETGSNPNPELRTLQNIAEALGVDIAELFLAARPEETSGHEHDVGGGSGNTEIDTGWGTILDRARSLAAGEFPEADSLEGDVLQAHAVLDRAVRRLGRAYANRRAAGDDER